MAAADRLVESVIDVDVPANATIGVTLSTELPLKITKLSPSSCFLGKVFIGDKKERDAFKALLNFDVRFLLTKKIQQLFFVVFQER